MRTDHPSAARQTLSLLLLPPLLAVGSTRADDINQLIHNQLTVAEQAAGWTLLFDGESLDRWRTYRNAAPNPQWQTTDGELTLTRGGGGDLISRDRWSDFELHLEWKISLGGNSGIFILADESRERIFLTAPEIQILDDARHPDNKLDSHRSGSLYDLIAAPAAAQLPAGVWNSVIVRHVNRHLQVWQNQVQTVDIQIGAARWKSLVAGSKFATWEGFGVLTEGHLGLQDHGDVVAFRNLKIRSLAKAP